MAADATGIPGFGDARYVIAYPEAIGEADQATWYGEMEPTWEEMDEGAWMSRGTKDGELTYEMTMRPGADCVTSHFKLTNLSDRTWAQSMAFNCLQCAYDNTIRDNECLRTWVRSEGEFKRLIELPRVFGPRPAIQLYSVEGAPPGRDIPFVARYESTPDAVIEPWMAIVSRDGQRLVATASNPGLYVFQNREYSCIHCATGFGKLEPGQTGQAVNKVFFVKARLEDWHRRMTAELGRAQPAIPYRPGG
jgi:hypothetical protein